MKGEEVEQKSLVLSQDRKRRYQQGFVDRRLARQHERERLLCNYAKDVLATEASL